MIAYHVRSRTLVDIYNDLKTEKLILSPYFQRKLVWRQSHKVDFIKTILLGYPFPEVFISRGTIDLEKMASVSGVVDGQQRLNSICEFVENELEVDGKTYSDLSIQERERFLKYEIAVIDLDLDDNDPRVVEIFKRLNRTFYALSAIEKMATEYASVEFMLVAKLLAGEFRGKAADEDAPDNIAIERVTDDPTLTQEFVTWANSQDIDAFHRLILESNIFSAYEISRQVHLMFVLNLMATAMVKYYNRNDKAKTLLDELVTLDDWPERDQVLYNLNDSAKLINRVKPTPAAFWYTKSNSFSLLIEVLDQLHTLESVKSTEVKDALKIFADSAPPDYRLAAKEGVNNLRERTLRGSHLRAVLSSACK